MQQLHEKSPCCQGKTIRYGQRRRRCKTCGKTWRAWKRKRGRKKRRSSFIVLKKYLEGKEKPLKHLAPKLHITGSAYHARMRQERDEFLQKTSWPRIPHGRLIAIADAIEIHLQEKIYTMYFILLRTIRSSQATITPSIIYPGKENYNMAWKKVFEKFLNTIQKRIIALVCDGNSGLVKFAKQHGWILQRCHFHLRHRIANYIRTGPMGKNRALACKVKKFIDDILLDTPEHKARKAVEKLQLILPTLRSQFLKTHLRGLTKNYKHYRSYLYFPHLHLPSTSNSVESLNSLIRNLQHRARGFSNLVSLQKWIEALCKHHEKIVCNGKK